MQFGKLFLFSVLLLCLISFGTVSASEDLNDTFIGFNEVDAEGSSLISVSNDYNRDSIDDSNNESLIVQSNEKLNRVDNSESTLSCENQNGEDIVTFSLSQDDENGVSDKKTAYLAPYILEDYTNNYYFYYGKTLRIGGWLHGINGNQNPTGNVTAVCNGNTYQGIYVGETWYNTPNYKPQ